jgi:hypothetical protein
VHRRAADHPEASHALKWIGVLYAIDECADDAARRAELRRTESWKRPRVTKW